jgi:hypothetical protein
MTKYGSITVTAVPVSHTITVSEGSGGTVVPNRTVTYGTVTVNHGGSQTFAITPNPGYSVASVRVDGIAQVPIPGSYTFTNVIADHNISATFTAYTPQTLYYNNFDAFGSFTGWITSGTVARYTGSYNGGLRNGTACIRLLSRGSMQRPISTTGYTNIIVSFAMGVSSLTGSQNISAEWSPDGLTWTTLTTIVHNDPQDDGHLHPYSYTLPSTADNKANFVIRFKLSPDTGSSDYGYVDDVVVRGTHL